MLAAQIAGISRLQGNRAAPRYSTLKDLKHQTMVMLAGLVIPSSASSGLPIH